MTTCNIGVVPETKHGNRRDLHTPAVAYCFTHQCRVSDGGCDRARIAQLEAALREISTQSSAPTAAALARRALNNN